MVPVRVHPPRFRRHVARRLLASSMGFAMMLMATSVTAATSITDAPGAVAATGSAHTSAQRQLQRPRPRPTPTPSSTTAPAPSTTATPTTSVGCDAPVPFGDAAYCPGYLNLVQRTWYGTGQHIVLTVVVTGVSGSQARVHGSFYCPDGRYCGALLASGTITFSPGGAVPAYGNIIKVFGVTTQGALTPTGFTVIGQCEPAWGDC